MLNLSKNNYTKQEIINTLHLKSGIREVKYRYDLLNRQEVKIGELQALGGRVGLTSLAQIKRRGTFSFKETELNDVDWLNDRVQPFFMLKMNDGNWIEYPLGVYVMSSPVRNTKSKEVYRDIEAYDTSLILLEDKFIQRELIGVGTPYTTAINRLLGENGIWKINIPASLNELQTNREFEIGVSKLEAINILLKEINYTSICLDENGYITAEPYKMPNDRETEYNYKDDELSIMKPDSIEEIDLFSIPNKFVIVASNPDELPLIGRYTNNRESSITSVPSRGRIIVDNREIDNIANQQALDDYTKRIAYEASNTYGKFIFNTANMPHHSYLDCLYCENKNLGISSKYIETSWEMELKAGGTMNHICRRVIEI